MAQARRLPGRNTIRAAFQRPLRVLLTGNSWWTFAVFAVLTVGLAVGTHVYGARWFPPSAMTVPVLAGGLLLRWRQAVLLVGLGLFAIVYAVAVIGLFEVRIGGVITVAVASVFALILAYGRERVGTPGLRGEQMFVELREKLAAQGELPPLPRPWHSEALVHPAGSGAFSGDFIVSVRDGDRLELAVVDVSGKGLDAGTRSLLLSGALGGLLGAVTGAEFLASANRYLERQEWAEGFATAVHVTLDLQTGDYAVINAGHPPAIRFDAGSGLWRVSEASGPALGLMNEPVYVAEHGRLRHGDALLLYTDGLVEERGRDLTVGIDRLMGAAEALVPRGFDGAAQELLRRLGARGQDDRAVVLLWRRS